MSTYQNKRTALILIDPFNDFLSENGKLWSFVKETVESGNVIANIKKVLTAARKHKIQVVYAPHRHTQKGDYLNWKFFSPSHNGTKNFTVFEKGTWELNFIRNSWL